MQLAVMFHVHVECYGLYYVNGLANAIEYYSSMFYRLNSKNSGGILYALTKGT